MPTMHFKDTVRLEDRATISLWLGDSQVWANTAVMLDERGRSKPGGGIVKRRPQSTERGTYPWGWRSSWC